MERDLQPVALIIPTRRSSRRRSAVRIALLLVGLIAAGLLDSGGVTAADESTTDRAAKSRAKTPKDGVVDITFDDIKFDIEKGDAFEREMLSDEIEELDDRRIRIRGYMLPSFQQKGIRQFVLVRDNMECCFGPGAALYDCIVVEMQSGKSTEFTVRPVAVQGVFKVKELKDPDGKHLAVYELKGESVR